MKILKIISLAIVCAIAANAIVFGAMNTGLGYEFVVYGSIAFTELMIIYWFVKWILGNNEQNYDCNCDYCDDEDDYTGFDDEDSNGYENYYKSHYACDCGYDSSHTARVDENVEDADIPDSDENSAGALSKDNVREEDSHNDVEKAFDNLVATAKSF